jgi:phage-related protein
MAGQSRTLKLSILGDVDQLKKSLSTGSTEVQGFGDKIGNFSKKAGIAFAAAGVAAAAYAGKLLVDGVKSAIADEAAQTKLATTLENVTGATNAQIKAVEAQILKTSLLTGKTDDELRPSLDRLLRSTKNVEEAQRLQAIALDISAGSGKSLEAVSNALAKASEGQTTALGKLGVGISAAELKTMSFEQITAKLAGTFEGQASKQADTFAGKMARLNVAFDEGKETVGSFVLDAITPLVNKFVNDVVPAIQKFADAIGPQLEPIIKALGTYINDTFVPAFKAIWSFLTTFLIPTFTAVLKPALEGLNTAFNTVKTAINDNSEELKPLVGFMKNVADFAKDTLAPILGGALKLALNVVAGIVAGLVTGFANLVTGVGKVVTAVKAFIKLMTDNPVTRFFGGGDNSKGLRAGTAEFDPNMGGGGEFDTGGNTFIPSADSPTFTGAPLGAYSPAMQAAILRREELKAETERLRAAREAAAIARTAATGGLSTAERIVINVNAASIIDEEGFTRAINDAQNNSFFRGTGGATNLVGI